MRQAMGEPRQLLARSERREAILAAAAVAFAHGGFAATSMDDVAGAAGVTKLILYRHFASKDELYRDVLQAVSDRLHHEFTRMHLPPGEGGPLRALLTVARENPDGYRLLVFHAVREQQFEPQVCGYFDEAVARLDLLLGPAVQEPAVRRWVVSNVVGFLLHSVLIWINEGDPDADDAFLATAASGLRALVMAWTGATLPAPA